MMIVCAVLAAAMAAGEVRFEKAESIWTTAEKGEINSSFDFAAWSRRLESRDA